MEYFFHPLIMIGIYSVFALSLYLLFKVANQLSLCHGAFFGLGAYISSIVSSTFSSSFWTTMPIVILLSIVLVNLISRLVSGSHDDEYILKTLAIQLVVVSLLSNWQSLTGGPSGVTGIAPLVEAGENRYVRKIWAVVISLFFASVVFFFLKTLINSTFGKNLIAAGNNKKLAKSLGKNVGYLRRTPFTIAGVIACFAGALYAHYITFISPDSFSLDLSLFALAIVMITGKSSIEYVFLSCVLLVIIPELLRFVHFLSSHIGQLRQIMFGLALVLTIYVQLQTSVDQNENHI